MMKKIFPLVAIVTIMSGCAQNLWYKPTARQGEFEVDRYACVQQSQQRLGMASVNRYGGSAIDQQITNDQVFSTCMTSKGWSLGRKEVVDSQIAQATAVNNSVKQQVAQVVEKIKAACASQEFREYYSKTACNTNDMSLAQLADNSKITEAQKIVFIKQQEVILAYNKEMYEVIRTAGPNGIREAENFKNFVQPLSEKNSLNLYMGSITWGEYNQRRKEIAREGQEAMRRNP